MNISDQLNELEKRLFNLIKPALKEYEKETGLVIQSIDMAHEAGWLTGMEITFSTSKD